MLDLEYYNDTKFSFSPEFFKKILELISKNFKNVFPKKVDDQKKHFITCTLVDDKVIQRINSEQRGINKPTDVVSLSYLGEDYPGQDMIGEIYISVETAAKQAEEQFHELSTEMKFLFVHGVLHILGYEHKTEEDFKMMMDLTNQILEIPEK